METKKCKECGRELSIDNYSMSRWGKRYDVCKECVKEKRADTRYMKKLGTQVPQNAHSYSDPDFDGKQPVEVLQLMKRAKMWLEAKGYSITLKGTYTQVREVKF